MVAWKIRNERPTILSQKDIAGNTEDEFSYQGTAASPKLAKPDTTSERTGSAILARLAQSEGDGKRRVVETLYKVVSESAIRPDTIVLRLWRLWGPARIDRDDTLVKCEYDTSTYEVAIDGVFATYRILDCHHLNNHSFIARVRPVDTRTLSPETPPVEQVRQNTALPAIARSLYALAETLGPGGTLLLNVRIEQGKETVDPTHFIVVRLSLLSPVAFGRGLPPEGGTNWRVVEKVTPDGIVETSVEYRVLSSTITSSESGWKAELENTSKVRKVFSLVNQDRAP